MPIEVKTVGEGKDVLFLLGYGITFEQPGTKWLMDLFSEHGLRTTFVRLPTDLKDHRTDLLEPCLEIEDSLDDHALVGLSMGGLVGAYMDRPRCRVFLSPFWGVSRSLHYMGYDLALQKLKKVRFRFLPRTFTKRDAGHHAVHEDIVGIPPFLSFSTLYQMVSMQEAIPPPREGDVVYRSRDDRIICHDAIDARGGTIRDFEGGHLVHLVRDRDAIFTEILSILQMSFIQDAI